MEVIQAVLLHRPTQGAHTKQLAIAERVLAVVDAHLMVSRRYYPVQRLQCQPLACPGVGHFQGLQKREVEDQHGECPVPISRSSIRAFVVPEILHYLSILEKLQKS